MIYSFSFIFQIDIIKLIRTKPLIRNIKKERREFYYERKEKEIKLK